METFIAIADGIKSAAITNIAIAFFIFIHFVILNYY